MLRFNTQWVRKLARQGNSLNTSHVKVQLIEVARCLIRSKSLNTSHVKVQPAFYDVDFTEATFKYISC